MRIRTEVLEVYQLSKTIQNEDLVCILVVFSACTDCFNFARVKGGK